MARNSVFWAQVQVWDVEQAGSDPVLRLSDGIDGQIAGLSWDSSSQLLAAATGSEVQAWDIVAAKEGRLDSGYVCIGFEMGAKVSCLAFQPDGPLLVGGGCMGRADAFTAALGACCMACGTCWMNWIAVRE